MAPRQTGWTVIVAVSGVLGCAGTAPHPSAGADAATGTGGSGIGAAGRDGGGIDLPPAADIAVTDGRVIGADALRRRRLRHRDAAGAAGAARHLRHARQLGRRCSTLIAPNSTTTKWDAVRDALIAFLQDPQSAGLGVGLQYFPLLAAGRARHLRDRRQLRRVSGPATSSRTCSMAHHRHRRARTQRRLRARGRARACGSASAALSDGYCSPAGGTAVQLQQTPTMTAALPLAGYCHGRDLCDIAVLRRAGRRGRAAAGRGAARSSRRSINTMPDGLTPTSGALAGAIAARAGAGPREPDPQGRRCCWRPTACRASASPPTSPASRRIASPRRSRARRRSRPTSSACSRRPSMADAQTNLDALAAAGGTAGVRHQHGQRERHAGVRRGAERGALVRAVVPVQGARGGQRRRADRLLPRQRAVHVRARASDRHDRQRQGSRRAAAPTQGGLVLRRRSGDGRDAADDLDLRHVVRRSCAPTPRAASTSCSAARRSSSSTDEYAR